MSAWKKLTGKSWKKSGAQAFARHTVAAIGGPMGLAALKPDERRKVAEYGLPAAGAIAGLAYGGPLGAMAGASIGQQGATAINEPHRIKEAEKKAQRTQRQAERKEVTRIARLAYEQRFMAGGRSILSTRQRGGKATVGA
jgi:hypothetical protein